MMKMPIVDFDKDGRERRRVVVDGESFAVLLHLNDGVWEVTRDDDGSVVGVAGFPTTPVPTPHAGLSLVLAADGLPPPLHVHGLVLLKRIVDAAELEQPAAGAAN